MASQTTAPSTSRLPSQALPAAPGALALCVSPRDRLSRATPAIASPMLTSVRRDGRSRSTPHDSRATQAGSVAVMTPAAVAVVIRTPESMSKVKRNVPKNVCTKRLRHWGRVTRRMAEGR